MTESTKSKPTIFVPPRGNMESVFMNGSGPGFSPGPMTMVSSFFAEQSPFSFSQLLAGAMNSPNMGNKPGFLSEAEKESEEKEIDDDGRIRSESSEGYKRNRPMNLSVDHQQPKLQMQQFDGLSPLFMFPPGLSPSGLLNSPGFLSPLQSPFGMSHQQALAHVTAQAAFSQSYMQMQEEIQRSSTATTEVVANNGLSAPSETLTNTMPTEQEVMKNESADVVKATYGNKPASDGYNWRKYGQKNVKASECPRSYYKCTHINCTVKKKVERSIDGRVSEITYKGQHNHDPPPPNGKRGKDNGAMDKTINSQVNSGFVPGQTEMNRGNEVVILDSEPANQESIEQRVNRHNDEVVLRDGEDDEPAAKRRVMDTGPSVHVSTTQTISESKIVVQTRSEVDLLDDGYKWRKYGQKVVKGNHHPRSYYRCTFPGCNVRKHVERASADPKEVITTYEGKHNHDLPAGRYNNHAITNSTSQQLKTQKTGPKSRSLKELDYGNSDQMPTTLQLKEEQIAA